MSGAKILCVVVTLGGHGKTLASIHRQTVKPDLILIADKKFDRQFAGERAGCAMRHALSQVNLDNFTHILRVDGDTVLPDTFIESALEQKADLVGSAGYAQLLAVKAFKELFGGIYPIAYAEDSVIHSTVLNSDKHVFVETPVKPILPPAKKYSKESWVKNGEEYYKLGYSIFGVLFTFKNHRSKTLVGFNLFYILKGWLKAFSSRMDVYEFAKRINRNKHFANAIIRKIKNVLQR